MSSADASSIRCPRCGNENRHDSFSCSFCGKRHDEVNKLIAGPDVNICDECVNLCSDIVLLLDGHVVQVELAEIDLWLGSLRSDRGLLESAQHSLNALGATYAAQDAALSLNRLSSPGRDGR